MKPNLMTLGLEFDLAKERMNKTWEAWKTDRTPEHLDAYTEALEQCENLRKQISETLMLPVPELVPPE